MSEGAEIGHAYLAILPSTQGFGRNILNNTRGELDTASRRSGRRYGDVFVKSSMGPIRAFGGVAAGFVAVSALKNIATAGIQTAANLEQAQIAFSTLLHSGDKAKRFLAGLSRFAARTPFEMAGLVDASRQLLGAGEAAKKVIPTLTAFGDASGALGLGQDQFNHIMLATTQAMSAGKLQAGDLLQITEAGLPVWKLLSEALGKPVAAVRKLSSSGKLLTADVLPKLQKQMEKDYGGAMSRQSKTLAGLWSTLMDTFHMGLAKVILPLEPVMRRVIPAAARAMGAGLKRASKFMARDVVPGIRKVRDVFANQILPRAKDLAGRVHSFGRAVVDAISGALSGGNGSASLGKTLGDSLGAAVTSTLSAALNLSGRIGTLFSKIDWASVGLRVGKGAVKFVTGFVIGFLANLGDALGVLKDHWWQAIVAALTIIPIGRIAGPMEKVIARIPILRIFSPILRGVARFGGLLEKAFARTVGRAVRFFGRAFLDGFQREAGPIFGGLRRLISGIVTHIYVWADDFAKAAKNLVEGFVLALRHNFERVGAFFGRVQGRITKVFKGAKTWLLKVGTYIIQGLWDGMKALLPKVGSWLKAQAEHLKHLATHPWEILSPSRYMFRVGKYIYEGMVLGLKHGFKSASRVLAQQTRGLQHFVNEIASKSAARDFSTTWTKALNDLGKQLDKLKNQFASLRSSRSQMASGISSNLISGASFANSPTPNLTGLISFKRQQAQQGREFRHDLGILRKRGLSKREVADLASQGLDALPTVVQLMTATNGQLHHIDALDATIRSNAKALGNTVAGSIYNPQLEALRQELKGVRRDIRGVGHDIHDAEQGIRRHHQLKAKTRTGGKKP